MTSRWRPEARKLIAETVGAALEEAPALRDNPGALIALVSKAYPFAHRKRDTWNVWLEELQLARVNIEQQLGPPLRRKCKACGARAGIPCRPLDETDEILVERALVTEQQPRRLARELAASIVHSARRATGAA